MSRYIDADKLTKEIEATYLDGESAISFTAQADGDTLIGKMQVVDIIYDQPTADVEEVKHGKWDIETEEGYAGLDDFYYCSVCGTWYDSVFVHACCADMERDIYKFPYCPNCGAKMDGEKEK